MGMKYAIKIAFSVDKTTKEAADWIYITDTAGSAEDFDYQVKTFETLEAAKAHAQAWKLYKIVEYNAD
jgi:hypothetical protein